VTTTSDPAWAALGSAILLVEDEPVLRASIARGLSKLTNIEVMSAATFAEAVALIGARAPSLVISDIDLPGASGLELVGELGRRGINVPIIFVTAYLKTYRSQIPQNPNVLVLEKPVPIEELRKKTTQLLGPAGDAMRTPFSVVDYVQLACLGHHSLHIDVEFVKATGKVIVWQGELWHASDEQGEGAEAFCRLAFSKEGTVICSPMIGEPGPRTIQTHWEVLVLESARILDEAQHREKMAAATSCPVPTAASAVAARQPTLSAPPAPASGLAPPARSPALAPARLPPPRPLPPPPPPREARTSPASSVRTSPPRATAAAQPAPRRRQPSFDELWTRGVDALLAREFEAAFHAFAAADALRPGDPRVVANLARLKEMGYSDARGGEG
jgi:CheY-like chemotaxis protein